MQELLDNDILMYSTRKQGKSVVAAENFAARLKQADLVNKSGFDNKLTSFNKLIHANKRKHLEVQRKLNSLITKDYSFS